MAARTCHEKGCNKLNKTRKTCGEQGMVSMDQLFKRLPQALQWEILTDFVGGYVVRYNRLRRLMSGELQKEIMEHVFALNYQSWLILRAKPFVRFPMSDVDNLARIALNRWRVSSFSSDGQLLDYNADDYDADLNLLEIVAGAEFSHRGSGVVLFKSKETGRLSYGVQCCVSYSHTSDARWYIMEVDDSVTLPPYEKHSYPSYPYTNKKLGRPVLKMKLHRMERGRTI